MGRILNYDLLGIDNCGMGRLELLSSVPVWSPLATFFFFLAGTTKSSSEDTVE